MHWSGRLSVRAPQVERTGWRTEGESRVQMSGVNNQRNEVWVVLPIQSRGKGR